MSNTIARAMGYTGTTEEIVWTQGNNVPVTAYLWGGGGGGGGSDSAGGGYGSGGGFSLVNFTVSQGDSIKIAVGGGGGGGLSGVNGEGGGTPGASYTISPVFNTRTTATSPLTYPQFNSNYCTFLNANGVWENPNTAAIFDRTWTVNFPVTGSYNFTGSVDNYGVVYIDGVPVFSCNNFTTTFEQSFNISAGNHTIRIQAQNTGGPGSVALAIGGGNSYGGGRGGNAGNSGVSGAGGGGGGATVLLLNNTVIAVAGGGAGGGGAGNTGVAAGADAPGFNGRASHPITAGQNGTNKNGDGGGAGGGGGGYDGGNGGTSPGGDSGGEAGAYGSSYSVSGTVQNSGSQTPAGSGIQYYSSYRGRGGDRTQNGATGYGTLVFTLNGIYAKTDQPGFTPINTTYIKDNNTWKRVQAIFIKNNNVWTAIRGAIAPIFNSYSNLFGSNPRDATGDTGGGGGGGCCVVSTAFAETGLWNRRQRDELIVWCETKLHNKTLGECFRRGYQVLGSKVIVPALKSKLGRAYYKWAFNNGTDLVRGKKFSWLSVPNTAVWIAGFMIVGAAVTTKYANKCWTSLYKDKK